ncbi:hypothetical protein CDL12_18681 [Handroanthus impetiginosus]|uniref:C2 domain-containing protein n=1 Tax=Handroanthus impetiginosus TaxID=429701 RepID=A0A2G9GU36_9LAMI|nr:hypothetical protein CDL12_18681 [Handroanthus impetiginosus]
MSISGIQGRVLEVTVVGCNKLKDTEWISRQDPYVCLEYASTKFRTRTCTDGGKNPTFQEKFVFTLIEGLRELSVVVWNSNTLTFDDFIGSGRVQLQKVLSQGYDDSPWPLQDKRGRTITHFEQCCLRLWTSNEEFSRSLSSIIQKPATSHAPSAPPYASTPPPQVPPYSAPPPVASYPPTGYPPAPLYPSYPPNSAGYTPPPYQQPAAYPPPYPPTSYPPQSAYPPPPHDPRYYPPGSYPPPPYPPPY